VERAGTELRATFCAALAARVTPLLAIVLAAALGALAVARDVAADPRVPHGDGLASRKGSRAASLPAPLLATLAQTHTGDRALLDADAPSAPRFDALLVDHVARSEHAIDPRLLGLLRALAPLYGEPGGAPRIEIVSGFRTPKLNEMRRKKGHHVALHSEHSLGHAVDFRIVRSGEARGVDPRELEHAIRAAGFRGGVGVYLLADDWFVHADVGPLRSWSG
jgi:uncharacterized protein YcbK (DUF882 family)